MSTGPQVAQTVLELSNARYFVRVASTCDDAVACLEHNIYQVVFVDAQLLGSPVLVERMKKAYSISAIVLVNASPSVALSMGVSDAIPSALCPESAFDILDKHYPCHTN